MNKINSIPNAQLTNNLNPVNEEEASRTKQDVTFIAETGLPECIPDYYTKETIELMLRIVNFILLRGHYIHLMESVCCECPKNNSINNKRPCNLCETKLGMQNIIFLGSTTSPVIKERKLIYIELNSKSNNTIKRKEQLNNQFQIEKMGSTYFFAQDFKSFVRWFELTFEE